MFLHRRKNLLFFLLFSFVTLYAESPKKELYDFYMACARGNLELAQTFLKKYPEDVNTELSQTFDNYEDYYISYKHFAEWLIIEKNIEFDNKEEEKKWIDNYKRYPINIAARYGNLDIVKLLLDYDCDVMLKEENVRTSLTVALTKSQDEIAYLLAQYDTSINKENEPENKYLLNAIYYGNQKTAEYLINKGFDINQRYNGGSEPTLFIESILGGNIETVKLLFYIVHNKAVPPGRV